MEVESLPEQPAALPILHPLIGMSGRSATATERHADQHAAGRSAEVGQHEERVHAGRA